MNSGTVFQIVQILIYSLIPITIILIGLLGYLVFTKIKEKSNKKEEDTINSSSTNNLNKQSIFNFMNFDKVEDNMIIQKNGDRYLMVIECQGINYDLMSGVEKTGVEEGFVQFLNTLRYPIQIYIQTRTINLESSLATYRNKVKEIEIKLRNMQNRFMQMKESDEYSDEQLEKAFYEITKQSNLYEYGKSVLQDTEKMSFNKNILNKKFYIVIPYHSSEAGSDKMDKAEIQGIAFSELYTKAQSLIRSISICGVRGRILRSNDLIDLLYMAYNRDEAEMFGLDKALKAGFDEMYSTAPDVLKKKMSELDKLIEERAIEMANEKVEEAKTELEKKIEEKEENIDDLIAEMAKLIIDENEPYIGTELKNKAIDKVDEGNTKEGGKDNGKKVTKGRRKSATN